MDAQRMMEAAMQGAANYLKWKQEFLVAWMESTQKQQLRMALAMMPPAMKEQLRQFDHKSFDRITDYLRQ